MARTVRGEAQVLPASHRRRAPRRHGERRQLTVPSDLWSVAQRYATQHGTTPNDGLVRLAEEGARRFRAEEELARRRASIERALHESLGETDGEGFLDPAEARDAAEALRRER